MKFIFLTIPAYGHLNAMLGVAKGLVDKGHKVIIYNTKEFEAKIRGTGAEFRTPPVSIEEIDFRLMRNFFKIIEISLEMTKLVIPPLIKIVKGEKPDCILHDSLTAWGKIVGAKTNTPAVSLVPSVGINLQVLLASGRHIFPDVIKLIKEPLRTRNFIREYFKLYRRYALKRPSLFDILSNTEKLNIIFTSRYFQPQSESFDDSFKFVGPIIYDRNEKEGLELLINSSKQLIYVSMGTVYNDDIEFYQRIIKTFADKSYRVFISTGKYINQKKLGTIPQNIFVKRYWPQLEILKKASLFISHGGMNSINESLYFGVPMILFPQIQEQRINSARVEELGAGIYYKHDLKSKIFLEKVEEVIKNSSYKSSAEKIGKTLKQAGGIDSAVNHILGYIQ
ncbi:hypothetical protein A3F60_03780 [Candidatus Roizmanbacteria bacterium RIFCSPHIGHO2_12_FULL_39_8]|uniref:UDP-glycosyltransferases domain-containing protein n=1 Tax=Candidatus Roizmanbacteria bacterium RIFCSPHIGHO2_12_FULL_39_8 TaxID=1802050 RepID=A0A1F7HVM8_9BACT|nr:MAG: hypothetical protein A3F60_03780 [Candidatus Roizmanbacteria bacterium RIFCSPHIGHO2_12_FULL_39_8]